MIKFTGRSHTSIFTPTFAASFLFFSTLATQAQIKQPLAPLPTQSLPAAGQQQAAAQNNYIDDVNSLSATGGVFHYYVMALEGPGNSYGFADSARSNTMMALQKPRVYVPSAFNPGSSHTENQKFIPVGVFINSKDYLFQIYNRWGQLLFETTEINKGWDGTYKGEDAAQGVYTYFVRFTTSDGQLFEKRGTVTLIR